MTYLPLGLRRAAPAPGGAIAFSASSFEAHHVLHDGFAGFGDFALLAHFVGARFAELLGFSGDLDGDELVGFVTA
jgi:hypothetical protein